MDASKLSVKTILPLMEKIRQQDLVLIYSHNDRDVACWYTNEHIILQLDYREHQLKAKCNLSQDKEQSKAKKKLLSMFSKKKKSQDSDLFIYPISELTKTSSVEKGAKLEASISADSDSTGSGHTTNSETSESEKTLSKKGSSGSEKSSETDYMSSGAQTVKTSTKDGVSRFELHYPHNKVHYCAGMILSHLALLK